ncbi:lipocalin family protein [Capnocytophaga ochracea]|uniref:lipocalin family protein n=1 Tax=Capnocytophaga ochracea TaxID=1018 RepID=UPI00241E9D2A|nr:lipocalin family protein [Capnocytophaga ochracea]
MKSNNKNVAWATFRTATQLVAIMAVILVTLIACGKSDSGGSVDNKNLIGTWKFESMTIDGVPKSLDEPEKGYIDKALENCNVKPFFVFTDKEVAYTSTIKNYINKVLFKCEVEKKKGSYSVSGNTISIIWEDKTGGSATISIVGNKLTFTSPVEDDKGNKHTSIITFVKQ